MLLANAMKHFKPLSGRGFVPVNNFILFFNSLNFKKKDILNFSFNSCKTFIFSSYFLKIA